MDPELLKQREAFKKRAAQQPTIVKRPQDDDDDEDRRQPKPKKSRSSSRPVQSALTGNLDLKATASGSAKFGTLVKVVDHLKKRHLDKQLGCLSLDEILEELTIFDIDARTRKWLMEEALPSSKRITEPEPGRFEYRPPYNVKGKNGLLKVLKKADMEGSGGILLSDLADCIANPEKIVAELGSAVISVTTQVNKKKDRVVFYNDPELVVAMDQEFKERWRMVSVDHLDEKKIEEYLLKHGIDSMKDLAPKKGGGPPKRKQSRRSKTAIVHNEHLEKNLLRDYAV